MTSLFLVFGTQGAGKTTVLKGAKGAKVISIGTEMLNVYSRLTGTKDRDEVRKLGVLDVKHDAEIRNGILMKISRMKGTIALDTHASLKTGDGYYSGFSFADLDMLKSITKAIIYVDAPTKQIIARRKRDKSRRREADSADEIEMHRRMNLSFTTIYAMRLQAPIFIVQNDDGGLVAAQKRVVEIIEKAK